ncbi:multicopper oxidase type 3 [Clostridium sp. DL-VIII]|uniref:multicopper oxidase domain-containing protein n=1 Tax=Clostridium sp. DL-VIII TaxID=641107 RepID=UPI00023B025F|nr:multicopper oxidase domain-containing protein [Clostridium sp. DL-VIII]EHJ01187.1 multicopper oxidase type 3 [Clostridium sp. DL-VIII]
MENTKSKLASPDIPFAKYYLEKNTRYFHLTAEPIKHNILSNLAINAFGYNCSTPGPIIVIKQGELISLTVENKLDTPTALHVHGLSKPNCQDGDPDIEPCTPKIMPAKLYNILQKFAWH